MSRVQLSLNVTDLDQAVDFYGRLFDAATMEIETAMQLNPDTALDDVLRDTATQIQRMKAASLAK